MSITNTKTAIKTNEFESLRDSQNSPYSVLNNPRSFQVRDSRQQEVGWPWVETIIYSSYLILY